MEGKILNIQGLRDFLMWCSIINGTLLVLWSLMLVFAADSIYRMHGKRFSVSREAFDIILYSFLGFYKILFLVFNLVPFLAIMVIN